MVLAPFIFVGAADAPKGSLSAIPDALEPQPRGAGDRLKSFAAVLQAQVVALVFWCEPIFQAPRNSMNQRVRPTAKEPGGWRAGP